MNLTLLKPFTKVLAVLMGFILLIGAPAANPEGWQNDLPDDTKLAFNVIADVHMETTNKYSRNVAVKIFRNMKEHSNHKDALVMLGDNTMNGKYSENLFLYGLLADIKPADRYLAVCGNHDTGNLGDVYNNVSVFISEFFNLHQSVSSTKYLMLPNYFRIFLNTFFGCFSSIAHNSIYFFDSHSFNSVNNIVNERFS